MLAQTSLFGRIAAMISICGIVSQLALFGGTVSAMHLVQEAAAPASLDCHLPSRAADIFNYLLRQGWRMTTITGSHHQFSKGGARLTVAAHGNGQISPVIRQLIGHQLARAHESGYVGAALMRRRVAVARGGGTSAMSSGRGAAARRRPARRVVGAPRVARRRAVASAPLTPLATRDQTAEEAEARRRNEEARRRDRRNEINRDLDFAAYLLMENEYKLAVYYVGEYLNGFHRFERGFSLRRAFGDDLMAGSRSYDLMAEQSVGEGAEAPVVGGDGGAAAAEGSLPPSTSFRSFLLLPETPDQEPGSAPQSDAGGEDVPGAFDGAAAAAGGDAAIQYPGAYGPRNSKEVSASGAMEGDVPMADEGSDSSPDDTDGLPPGDDPPPGSMIEGEHEFDAEQKHARTVYLLEALKGLSEEYLAWLLNPLEYKAQVVDKWATEAGAPSTPFASVFETPDEIGAAARKINRAVAEMELRERRKIFDELAAAAEAGGGARREDEVDSVAETDVESLTARVERVDLSDVPTPKVPTLASLAESEVQSAILERAVVLKRARSGRGGQSDEVSFNEVCAAINVFEEHTYGRWFASYEAEKLAHAYEAVTFFLQHAVSVSTAQGADDGALRNSAAAVAGDAEGLIGGATASGADASSHGRRRSLNLSEHLLKGTLAKGRQVLGTAARAVMHWHVLKRLLLVRASLFQNTFFWKPEWESTSALTFDQGNTLFLQRRMQFLLRFASFAGHGGAQRGEIALAASASAGAAGTPAKGGAKAKPTHTAAGNGGERIYIQTGAHIPWSIRELLRAAFVPTDGGTTAETSLRGGVASDRTSRQEDARKREDLGDLQAAVVCSFQQMFAGVAVHQEERIFIPADYEQHYRPAFRVLSLYAGFRKVVLQGVSLQKLNEYAYGGVRRMRAPEKWSPLTVALRRLFVVEESEEENDVEEVKLKEGRISTGLLGGPGARGGEVAVDGGTRRRLVATLAFSAEPGREPASLSDRIISLHEWSWRNVGAADVDMLSGTGGVVEGRRDPREAYMGHFGLFQIALHAPLEDFYKQSAYGGDYGLAKVLSLDLVLLALLREFASLAAVHRAGITEEALVDSFLLEYSSSKFVGSTTARRGRGTSTNATLFLPGPSFVDYQLARAKARLPAAGGKRRTEAPPKSAAPLVYSSKALPETAGKLFSSFKEAGTGPSHLRPEAVRALKSAAGEAGAGALGHKATLERDDPWLLDTVLQAVFCFRERGGEMVDPAEVDRGAMLYQQDKAKKMAEKMVEKISPISAKEMVERCVEASRATSLQRLDQPMGPGQDRGTAGPELRRRGLGLHHRHIQKNRVSAGSKQPMTHASAWLELLLYLAATRKWTNSILEPAVRLGLQRAGDATALPNRRSSGHTSSHSQERSASLNKPQQTSTEAAQQRPLSGLVVSHNNAAYARYAFVVEALFSEARAVTVRGVPDGRGGQRLVLEPAREGTDTFANRGWLLSASYEELHQRLRKAEVRSWMLREFTPQDFFALVGTPHLDEAMAPARTWLTDESFRCYELAHAGLLFDEIFSRDLLHDLHYIQEGTRGAVVAGRPALSKPLWQEASYAEERGRLLLAYVDLHVKQLSRLEKSFLGVSVAASSHTGFLLALLQERKRLLFAPLMEEGHALGGKPDVTLARGPEVWARRAIIVLVLLRAFFPRDWDDSIKGWERGPLPKVTPFMQAVQFGAGDLPDDIQLIEYAFTLSTYMLRPLQEADALPAAGGPVVPDRIRGLLAQQAEHLERSRSVAGGGASMGLRFGADVFTKLAEAWDNASRLQYEKTLRNEPLVADRRFGFEEFFNGELASFVSRDYRPGTELRRALAAFVWPYLVSFSPLLGGDVQRSVAAMRDWYRAELTETERLRLQNLRDATSRGDKQAAGRLGEKTREQQRLCAALYPAERKAWAQGNFVFACGPQPSPESDVVELELPPDAVRMFNLLARLAVVHENHDSARLLDPANFSPGGGLLPALRTLASAAGGGEGTAGGSSAAVEGTYRSSSAALSQLPALARAVEPIQTLLAYYKQLGEMIAAAETGTAGPRGVDYQRHEELIYRIAECARDLRRAVVLLLRAGSGVLPKVFQQLFPSTSAQEWRFWPAHAEAVVASDSDEHYANDLPLLGFAGTASKARETVTRLRKRLVENVAEKDLKNLKKEKQKTKLRGEIESMFSQVFSDSETELTNAGLATRAT